MNIIGRVILTVSGTVMVNGVIGHPSHAELLQIRIATGALTLNRDASVHGFVVVPVGTVSVNGMLTGGVVTARLIVNRWLGDIEVIGRLVEGSVR